ncbi:hypothetical protein COCSUDRAFT_66044 [Coccomyxa subellipsoidea C-169]|uniref:Uncharacterized protein n=1 Tax=Coccomyxa subellipsoidea (strain C-169) TaxID=574566 RepID=I0YZ62_COCSC|nr:hypothetical protein COCSUDRAFT_66044 [Coccomyxa subellipsoidea C-169]EIE23681.1 hypothetical protein COCSUDRAFT_66044 [Coccomyxa subellipsoidea C-169]|eukprot:XP_005648225.1 hypothetical protein COCSUDRAFT_66044 [Coccomyxa subellipsoidea C-169]
MRSIAVVVLLATCSHVLAVKDVPIIREVNNVVGSIVALENSILAPLAPFGRKLQSLIPAVPNPDPNVIKANAIGSIFYVAGGLYNPELYKAAITGVKPAGRRLQTFLPSIPITTAKGPDGFPDPYGFIPAANLVASALKGKFPHRKLSSTDEELKWDAEAVHESLGFNRKLQQDNVLANALGSIVYGGVQTVNTIKETYGRKLKQVPSVLDPTRTGFLGTGSKAIQENAILSIAGDPALLNDPLTVRQSVLGFQQSSGRKLHSEAVKVDAATSIASGDISYDNVHKAIFGFNQGTEGRHLLSEAVKVDAATSIASGDISYDNVHKAIFGFNQGTEGRRLLSEDVKVDAATSIVSGDVTYDNVHKAIFGFNQGKNL